MNRQLLGAFFLGHPEGKDDPRLFELARILEPIGPCELTKNLMGKRWTKLAFNCAVSSLGAIGGDRVGPLMELRFVRRLALEIMSEVVEVAGASGVKLEHLSGTIDLEWLALTPEERLVRGSGSLLTKHALMLAAGFRYRRMRSSMLSALERGRPPAVDFLNGEVVVQGAKTGISTPANALVQQTLWQIHRKEASSSVETLRHLYDQIRP